jgi:hypothetical protein
VIFQASSTNFHTAARYWQEWNRHACTRIGYILYQAVVPIFTQQYSTVLVAGVPSFIVWLAGNRISMHQKRMHTSDFPSKQYKFSHSSPVLAGMESACMHQNRIHSLPSSSTNFHTAAQHSSCCWYFIIYCLVGRE